MELAFGQPTGQNRYYHRGGVLGLRAARPPETTPPPAELTHGTTEDPGADTGDTASTGGVTGSELDGRYG